MIWIWLWDIRACEGGDLQAIAAKAASRDVGVMVKVHDGEVDAPNGPRGLQLITALRDADVRVRSWGYCYPQADLPTQANFARQSLAAGAECYIADAEIEWERKPAQATAFAPLLPPGSGYSPLPIIDLHRAYPYAEFNALGVALPQAYAGTGGRDATGAFTWSEDNWRRWCGQWNASGGAVPAIEWAVYAADQSADELRTALQLATGPAHFGTGDASIWSWQHMTDEHWSVVDAFVHQEEIHDMETLQRTSGHLVAPYARAGSTLHLANPADKTIDVPVIKDGPGANVFAQNLRIGPWSHHAVVITADAAPLFVEDANSELVATLETPRR